jgi:hypothetical protein
MMYGIIKTNRQHRVALIFNEKDEFYCKQLWNDYEEEYTRFPLRF